MSGVNANAGNTSKLWQTFQQLLGRNTQQSCPLEPEVISDFFVSRVDEIRQATAGASPSSFCTSGAPRLSCFRLLDPHDVFLLIKSASSKSCALDPLPAWVLQASAQQLAPYVTLIENASLSSGLFPTSFKRATVTPVLKKASLDRFQPKNYRPISNLSFLSKLLERVVASQLSEHLALHDLLPVCQSAYRPGHSTETALVKILADIATFVDSGHLAVLLLLDLSSAFDTVDHDILLCRLGSSFGLCETALTWCRSYLSGRSQIVTVGNNSGSVVNLLHGVPQGSVLGPLFFILYTAPIFSIIEDHGFSGHAYADDTQCYDHCLPAQLPAVVGRLQNCFDDLSSWMASNRLKLNASKSGVIFFGSRHRLSAIEIDTVTLGGVPIKVASSVRNLGVTLDSELSFSDHAAHLTATCRNQLRQLWQIRPFLSNSAAEIVVHAFVTSRLDFCNAILVSSTLVN